MGTATEGFGVNHVEAGEGEVSLWAIGERAFILDSPWVTIGVELNYKFILLIWSNLVFDGDSLIE